MKSPWSISTTVRNPERLRDFLKIVKQFEGSIWNEENQIKFQISLIQNRLYGFGNSQFYGGLPRELVDLVDNIAQDIPFEKAKEIFEIKNYQDPAMRGRQSLNPLKKLGFLYIKDGVLYFSDLGNLFLQEDYDIGEIFLKCFIKLQFPNPGSDDFSEEDGFNIKPFIGTLYLIDQVNKKREKIGNDPVGINKHEFCLFAITLIDYSKIEEISNQIIELRKQQQGKPKNEKKLIFEQFQYSYVKNFLGIDDEEKIKKTIDNFRDYGDNVIRYFRLTRFIHIRGNGFYIDLEQRRKLEIQELFNTYDGSADVFSTKEEYFNYLADINKPVLPWEEPIKLKLIINSLVKEIKELEISLNLQEFKEIEISSLSNRDLVVYIEKLREYRIKLQNKISYQSSQGTDKVKEYIAVLKNIYEIENRPLELEKYATFSLEALNDALQIKPNYPVGDDGEPINTAPGGKPDIECFYEKNNAICEVTMLTRRDQWYNEGQPVMRHLRDFEENYKDKMCYCLFIAPGLHRDTINTFRSSIKWGYEGKPQKIIPLSLGNFIAILDVLVKIKEQNRKLTHDQLFNLYDDILLSSNEFGNPQEWIESIPNTIDIRENSLFNK